jgi:hypothetical protein
LPLLIGACLTKSGSIIFAGEKVAMPVFAGRGRLPDIYNGVKSAGTVPQIF